MGKVNKIKKNKVPKINEEEYAAYIAHLKEETKTTMEANERSSEQAFMSMEHKTE